MWILKNGIPAAGMPQRVSKNSTGEGGWNVIQFIRSLPFGSVGLSFVEIN